MRDPDATERVVPAFVRGDRWIARYASGVPGEHTWSSEDAQGALTVTDRISGTGRLAHGPLVVSADQRRLEHADGTPFLWLADTWWHAFVSVKCSDTEFDDLARKRAEQGFSVVQVVAGLPAEVGPFDDANRSAAGFAWEPGFAAVNLDWWDDADTRMQSLLAHDLVPCVLGSWGYHLSMMTSDQAARHWREMTARWGAYPVVWCVAGEPQNAWYDDLAEVLGAQAGALIAGSTNERGSSGVDGPADIPAAAITLKEAVIHQIRATNQLAAHLRATEPFGWLLTVLTVPGTQPWEFIGDPSLIDRPGTSATPVWLLP